MRLIDADELSAAMYHEAFEKDSDMQRWDAGCWIRYKLFEHVVDSIPSLKFTNKEWIDFLCDQFDISRTSAREMLHAMMCVKKEDTFKKQFNGGNADAQI